MFCKKNKDSIFQDMFLFSAPWYNIESVLLLWIRAATQAFYIVECVSFKHSLIY